MTAQRTPGPNDWTINDDGHLVQSDGACFNLDDAANILTDYDHTLDTLAADNAWLREENQSMADALSELIAEHDTRNEDHVRDRPDSFGFGDTGGIALARTILDVRYRAALAGKE